MIEINSSLTNNIDKILNKYTIKFKWININKYIIYITMNIN